MTRVLFLGGLGRSGTTLVERVFGQLPGVCALGEVVHLWHRGIRNDERCGCGARFSTCTFWRRVGEAAFGGWSNVDLDRVTELQVGVERTRYIPKLAGARLSAGHRALVDEYVDHYLRVYRAAAEVTNVGLVLDSSKHSALAHCLRWSQDLDLRVVQVIRDARGVAYSWTKTVVRPETEDDDAMTRYSPGRSAMLWNAHNAAIGMLAKRGVPVRRMRYEQFLADPRGVVRDIAEFADLPITDSDLRYLGADHVDLGPGHSVAGNPMRFTVGRLPLRPDNAWLRTLPAHQRRLVGTVCAPLLRAYGYPLRKPAEIPAKPAAGAAEPGTAAGRSEDPEPPALQPAAPVDETAGQPRASAPANSGGPA